MRRPALSLMVLAMVILAGAAASRADHLPQNFVRTGVVKYPSASARAPVSSLMSPCSETSEWNGFDALWIPLPASTNVHPFWLTATRPGDDVDAVFYSASCTIITTWRNSGNEIGMVPPGAAWIAVGVFFGNTNAPFTLRVEKANP